MISPRFLITGDPTLASRYVGLAKSMAIRAFEAGLISKVWRVADGVIVRVANNVQAGICKVFIRAVPVDKPFFASVWQPEGLLLTPKTAAAPNGYGFPKRNTITGELINPPFGTLIEESEDECLNQVLINRFPNNKYLDRREFILGIPVVEDEPVIELPEQNPRLRSLIEDEVIVKYRNQVVYWPLFFEPDGQSFWELDENRVKWVDNPGINSWTDGYKFFPLKKPSRNEDGEIEGEIPYRQFGEAGQSLIYEEETLTWYCHWPEELLYDSDAAEAIFQETNRYRNEVGREPLSRELRGFANTSRMILSEMQRARVQYHNNEELYRPGYGTVLYRALNGSVNFISGGENLITGSSLSGYSYDTGINAALGWRNSPLHYANMISNNWSSPKYSTSLDVFGNVGVTITEKGSTAGTPSILDDIYDPPITGRAWSQLFLKRDRWLYAGTCEHRTQYGVLTTGNYLSPIGRPVSSSGVSFYLFYKGRIVFIKTIFDKEKEESLLCRNYGAFLFMDNGVLSYRVIFGWVKNNNSFLSSCKRPVHGEHLDWITESVFDLSTEESPFMTCFWFYPEGNSGFALISELLTDHEYAWYFTDLPSDAAPVCPVGQRIINFDSGIFYFGDIIKGPNIVYTMSAYDLPSGKYDYLQEGSGTVNLVPFISEAGELEYIKYEMEHSIDQHWTGSSNSSTEVHINDTLIFKSGKRLKIRQVNFSGEINANDGQYEAIDSIYFINFFYFNPVTEDVAYLKHHVLLNDGTFVGGESVGTRMWTEVYVNDTLIKDYPSVALTTIGHTQARGVVKLVDGISGDYAFGALCSYLMFTQFGGSWSIPGWYGAELAGGGTHIRSAINFNPSEYAYFSKAKVGTYPASISSMFARTKYYTLQKDGIPYTMTHGYEIGIPYAWSTISEGLCHFASYKGRLVTQVYIDNIWRVNSTTTLFEDRNTVFSNFDINTEVGIGEITDIIPCGVIYG